MKKTPKKGFYVNRRRSFYAHLFKLLYIIGVLLIVNLALIASFYIIYDRELETFAQSFSDYLATMPLMMVAAIIYIDLFGMTHFFRKTRSDILTASFRFVFLEVTSAAAFAFFLKYFTFPRRVMVLGSLLMLTAIYLWSLYCLYLSKRIYSKGRIMIAARTREDADRLYAKLMPERISLHLDYMGYVLLGSDPIDPVIPMIDACTEVLVSGALDETVKTTIFLYCTDNDKTVYIVPQFTDLVYTRFRVIQFQDMPTFMIDSLGLTFQQRLLKRTFDMIFSLFALILTLPLQLAILVMVKMDTPGPAIYSQERITLSGRVYRVYKFRTMVDAAEEKFGAFQSSNDDPRVTRTGRFLRNLHLDELPQFFNILRGDMSVVGPRSDRPITVSDFEQQIAGYSQRLKVKAGLTGLAQIYGKYNSDPEDKLRFDLMYIKNYSFLQDLKIIVQSVRSMFPGKENYVATVDCAENYPFQLPG